MLKLIIYISICFGSVLISTANQRDWNNSPNPTVFNIGGVLSSNESEKYFQETIAVSINQNGK